jgi:hypothetical protein
MAIFPVLDHEERLQLGDKTRLNAEKCFVAPLGTTAIATVAITPGLDGSSSSVYDSSTQENWYLDWIFNSWTFDIVAGYNDKIDFNQGGEKVATITPATYTLATLLDEIETRLNAVSGISGTFTVSSDEKDRITISNDTASFELLPVTGDNSPTSLLAHIGFKKDLAGSSVTGKRVEYSQKKVVLSINNGGVAQTVTKYVKVYSVAGDALFSNDQDLLTWETDIMKYVARGRSTYLNIHREAQDQIVYWLDKEGYTNVYQEKYDKFDIIDVSEVNEWSAFLTLSILMWNISNKVDDVFLKRHFEYKNKAQEARNRAVLRLDINEDGVQDVGENIDIKYGSIYTR